MKFKCFTRTRSSQFEGLNAHKEFNDSSWFYRTNRLDSRLMTGLA